MARKNPSLLERLEKQLTARRVGEFIALLIVVGLLPVLVIGIGGVAVSSVTLAGLYFVGQRYGVWSQ